MTKMELVKIDTLSNDDALARLFELSTKDDVDSAELARLEAVVYGRLAQAYDADELPVLQKRAA